MGGFSIAGSLNLSMGFLGESNAEHSQDVSVGGLSLNEGLDKGVPFLDHGASLISGDVHTVEVSEAIESLDLSNLELELSPVLSLLRVVAISKRNREYSILQGIGRVNETGSLVARGQGNVSLVESWGKDVVPLFLGEWMSSIKNEK
jgi:hypothetical protein